MNPTPLGETERTRWQSTPRVPPTPSPLPPRMLEVGRATSPEDGRVTVSYGQPHMPGPHFQHLPQRVRDVISLYDAAEHGAHYLDSQEPVPSPSDLDDALAQYAYLLQIFEERQRSLPARPDDGELDNQIVALLLHQHTKLLADSEVLRVMQHCLLTAKRQQVRDLKHQLATERQHLALLERNETGFGAMREHVTRALARAQPAFRTLSGALRRGMEIASPSPSRGAQTPRPDPSGTETFADIQRQLRRYGTHVRNAAIRSVQPSSSEPAGPRPDPPSSPSLSSGDDSSSARTRRHQVRRNRPPPRPPARGGKRLPPGYGGKQPPPGYGGKRPRSPDNEADEETAPPPPKRARMPRAILFRPRRSPDDGASSSSWSTSSSSSSLSAELRARSRRAVGARPPLRPMPLVVPPAPTRPEDIEVCLSSQSRNVM